MRIEAKDRQLSLYPRGASRPRLERVRLLTSMALLASIAIGGCGGGGGGFNNSEPDPNGGTSLNTRLLWQQRAAGRGVAQYAATLPAAVRAVRIAITFSNGTQCCVSVDPRHEVFDDSQSGLVVDNLAPGDSVLEIAGFPVPIAPAEGVDLLCAVTPVEVGDACAENSDRTASFRADPVEILLIGGSRRNLELEIDAKPFVVERSPEAGETLRTPGVVSMIIADAATGIDESTVVLKAKIGDAPEMVLTPDSIEECDDLNLDKIACSPDRELEVLGLRVETTLEGAGQDPVGFEMTAKNASVPSSDLFDSFAIDTIPDELEVTFRLPSPGSIGGLKFDVDYSATDGTFSGTGDAVDCTSLLRDDILVSFDDREDSRTLNVQVSAKPGFDTPADVARCRFVDFDNLPSIQSFPLTVIEASDRNSVPLQPLPPVSVSSVEVVQ